MAQAQYDYLVIGGGLAGANAVKELAEIRPGSRIGILAAENELPYRRPSLSKAFLQGTTSRESIILLDRSFYIDHGIDLRLGNPAVKVNPQQHLVTAGDGAGFGYDKLLIASGCSLRKLSIPGSHLPGLCYLRTIVESESIKAAAANARQAVVIGAGFIGLEVASVLAQLDIGTTILHRRDRLFEKFANENISSFFEKYFEDRGVHVIYEDEAAELQGEEWVESVNTKAGRTLPCDFAVAGIGVVPDTSYLDGSGIEIRNGVMVDECLKSSDDDIYAAGDVANFYDSIYGRHRRVEHWDNAIRQGRTAARNMTGGRAPYKHVSYFYSTVFGLTFEFYGDMSDYDETIDRGSFDNGSVGVFYLKEGVLQAAFLLNRPRPERDLVERLISEHRQLGPVRDHLSDERVPLEVALAN